MGENSSKRQMLHGSIWTMSLRWSVRISGLVSTVILARLLTPADYGIVSIAALIVGSMEIFSQTGQDVAIIRHPNPTREHFDSAWTIQLLLGFGLGVMIWLTIPLATAYFQEPRAGSVVAVLAVRTMIAGTINTGVLNFQRRLEFSKQFRFNILPTVIAFVVTLTAAIILRNYWALVIGIMTKTTSSVVLSFVMEPFRPRLTFSKTREIWSFSTWSMIRAIGVTINYQVDKVAIGGFAGAGGMGRYEVARDFATSPTQELVLPIVSVMIPVMARVQHDKVALRELYMNVLYWSSLICISTGLGVALVAKDLADLVLGPKWNDVGILMPWFAVSWAIWALSSSVASTLDAIGHPMVSARLQWLRVLILMLAVSSVAYESRSVLAVAITTFVVNLGMSPIIFVTLARILGIPGRAFLLVLWQPVCAGILMAAAVLAVNAAIDFFGPPRLLLDVVVGVSTYTGSLMILWHLAGQRHGFETDVYLYVRNTAHRLYRFIRVDTRSVEPPS